MSCFGTDARLLSLLEFMLYLGVSVSLHVKETCPIAYMLKTNCRPFTRINVVF